MAGYVLTALVVLSADDAERLRNKLNALLGLTKEKWTALAAKSMCAAYPAPCRSGHPVYRCRRTAAACSGG